MFALICLLIIIPYIYGLVFINKMEGSRLLAIPCGLMVELLAFAMVSLPTIFFGGSFSVSVNIYICLNVVLIIGAIIKYNKQVFEKVYYTEFVNGFFQGVKKKSLILMIAIVLFQCGRSTLFEYCYGDNRVYTAIVNDTVETDEYFALNDYSGNLIETLDEAPTRCVLASWYVFEALLSFISDIKPLIMIYTILPGYLLALFYIVWWSLSYYFFKGDLDKTSFFIVVLALFNEFNAEDSSSYLLYWPTYGKNITMSVVLTLFILFWIYYKNQKDRLKYIFLMILMAAGCAASTMGLIVMPITLSFLYLIEAVKNRRLTLRMMIQYVGLMFPIFVYVLLYIRML